MLIKKCIQTGRKNTKRGAYDDGVSAPDNDYDYGNKGEDIFGGAAVMLFTESFYGDTASQTPYSSFKMDANSKIFSSEIS